MSSIEMTLKTQKERTSCILINGCQLVSRVVYFHRNTWYTLNGIHTIPLFLKKISANEQFISQIFLNLHNILNILQNTYEETLPFSFGAVYILNNKSHCCCRYPSLHLQPAQLFPQQLRWQNCQIQNYYGYYSTRHTRMPGSNRSACSREISLGSSM